MEERIEKISKVLVEDREKYHDCARKKIIVDGENEFGKFRREEYLDDSQASKDVNNFINVSKAKKLAIHLDSFNRTWVNRLVWNLIMLIFEAGAFFAIPSISNFIVNAYNANASVMGVLNTYLISVVCGGMIYYVNQKKFYYLEEELEDLKIISADINQANDLLAKIASYKELEYQNQRKRDDIDYHDVIVKNHNRNADWYYAKQKEDQETIRHARKGIYEGMDVNAHKTPLGTIHLGDYYRYSDSKINKKPKFKKAMRNVKKWIVESFEDPEYDDPRRRR